MMCTYFGLSTVRRKPGISVQREKIIYIICRLPIQKDTLPKDIEMVLRALEPFGFLNLHNPKHGIAFEIKG